MDSLAARVAYDLATACVVCGGVQPQPLQQLAAGPALDVLNDPKRFILGSPHEKKSGSSPRLVCDCRAANTLHRAPPSGPLTIAAALTSLCSGRHTLNQDLGKLWLAPGLHMCALGVVDSFYGHGWPLGPRWQNSWYARAPASSFKASQFWHGDTQRSRRLSPEDLVGPAVAVVPVGMELVALDHARGSLRRHGGGGAPLTSGALW